VFQYRSHVTAALYATIWISLALFAAALTPRSRHDAGNSRDWRWYAFATGAALCAVHIVLAMGVHYRWSHEAAVRETAARSAEVYGFGWRGGIYVNYAFVLAWVGEVAWWRGWPASYAARSRLVTWSLRVFYLVIVINAAIVFASPAGRVAGSALLAWMIGSALMGRCRGRT
jgi:hypothetical protein